MATAVLMPKLGLTMTSGAVGLWVVEEGQAVAVGDIVVEVVTEKITYQVDALVAGVLLKILVEEGEEVPVGTVIGVIGEPGEDISALLAGHADPSSAAALAGPGSGAAAETKPTTTATATTDAAAAASGGRITASPAARRLATELGVDLATVVGTGPGGRVTTDDVKDAAESAAYGAPSAAAVPGDRPSDHGERRVLREIPYSGVRRAIGEHMVHSHTVSPTVTHHTRADVEESVRLLDRLNEGRAEGDRISFTAAVLKATAAAIRAEPSINASLVDDVIRVWERIDLGVAVSVTGGLVVPVVRDADAKPIDEISRELAELARRSREGLLTPDEVNGGTFTITNVGGFRSVDWFTPIINQPESAILGVGRIVDEVVARGGAPAVRATVGLSLTFDHRIIDGAPAAAFLRILLDHLEEPERLLG